MVRGVGGGGVTGVRSGGSVRQRRVMTAMRGGGGGADLVFSTSSMEE